MTQEKNRKWEEGGVPPLTVVMIGHRSVGLLSRAISSLVRFSPPEDRWELVLIVNGDCREIHDFASALMESEVFSLTVLRISECRPGAARNVGVRFARSDLLLFLDDDTECFQDVVGAALKLFRDPRLQGAGGANLTPPNSRALARATGSVMGTWFGAASMRQRYRSGAAGPADEHSLILCNLALRKSVFESERGFAVQLISNEENVLLQRLAVKGALLWSSPELAVFHRRRDSWSGLCVQAAKYGAGRAQNLLLVPESRRALYFLPLALLLYVVSAPFFALSVGSLAFLPLAVYLLLSLAFSAWAAALGRDPALLLGFLIYPCVHLSYGLGFLKALIVWAGQRDKLQEQAG